MADSLRDQLQHALGDRYALARELPPGGMSRLFVATETALDRQVVVKLLPPDAASEASAERFRREMLVTARLQHPHILPVLDAGTRDSLLYYVMPYVPGESLRARIQRDGTLAVAEVTRILRELTGALVCAHTAGVVHRDIKPENVLFQHGHAVLADFGVARVLIEANLGDRLTATGLGLGTLGYMAPEQLGGGGDVDARADLYALGVLGYEMLAGEPPFAGAAPVRLIAMHLTERPRPVDELRAETPPALAGLLMRLLEKDPESRPATAAHVLRDLEAIETPRRAKKRAPATNTGPGSKAHDMFIATVLRGAQLTDDQFAWLKSAFVPRAFKKGQFFVRSGEVANRGGFVSRGLFRYYRVDASGNESIVRFSQEGSWIGDLHSANTGAPTELFIDAIEPAEALIFDMPSFERMLGLHPDGRRRFQEGLEQSRAAMERRVATMLHSTAEERYAEFVTRLPALAVRVPQRMLASYLGIKPETLSRIRRSVDQSD